MRMREGGSQSLLRRSAAASARSYPAERYPARPKWPYDVTAAACMGSCPRAVFRIQEGEYKAALFFRTRRFHFTVRQQSRGSGVTFPVSSQYGFLNCDHATVPGHVGTA